MSRIPSRSDPRLSRRRALAAAVLLAACPSLASTTEPDGAERFMSALGERAASIAREREPAAQRRAVAALMDEAADLPLMARLALGRHWATASEAQRRDYLELFRTYALDGLAARFDAPGEEHLKVTGSRPAGDADRMVSTEVSLAAGQPPLTVEWRVRRQGDRYRIVDLVAEGVSFVVTNRAEFDAIVSRRGLDGLLQEMRRWQAEAARRPGQS